MRQLPSWIEWMLQLICPEAMLEELYGDFLEQYQERLEQKGKIPASLLVLWNTLRLIHPSLLLRNRKIKHLSNMGLFRSHLLVAIRNMRKYRFYAIVNVFGLSLAVTFVFLCYLFIRTEVTYDEFHENKDRVYRVNVESINPETGVGTEDKINGFTPIPLVEFCEQAVPFIESFTRYGSLSTTIQKEQEPYEEKLTFVDPGFFEMFSFPIVQGSSAPFSNTHSIVLSQEGVLKYFGEQDPVGQHLEVTINDSLLVFEVSAVIDNRSAESSFEFDYLIPFQHMEVYAGEETYQSYDYSFSESWVMLDGTPSATAEQVMDEVLGDRIDALDDEGVLHLQQLADVHFNLSVAGLQKVTDLKKLYILAALAILVFTIAMINFITLTIGHSMHRIKEIGLRKVFGAPNASLKLQMILEATCIAVIASIVSIGLSSYFIPSYNQLMDGTIATELLLSQLPFLVLVVCIISLLTGGIQSVVLVHYKTIRALRGHSVQNKSESWINRSVIVFQFAMSALLISGTIVMHQQMHFIQSKDLGFDQQQLVEVTLQSSDDVQAAKQFVNTYRAELLRHPSVLNVGSSMNGFREPWTSFGFQLEDDAAVNVYFNLVDKDYVEAMGIELLYGNSFKSQGLSSTDILVNERLVKELGLEDPIGKQLPFKGLSNTHRIVGVVKDFHFGSLHQQIQPVILAMDLNTVYEGIFGVSTYLWPVNYYSLSVRVSGADLMSTVNDLEEEWHRLLPDKPFEFNFVDDMVARQYQQELNWQKILDVSAVFSLVIAWIGLIGLTRLTMQRKVKEIGIRKVLGASVIRLASLFTRDYMLMVGVACVLACPIAWWLMSYWLETFTYRIELSPWIFAVGCLMVVFVTILSVGLQTFRAALANPVESLRDE